MTCTLCAGKGRIDDHACWECDARGVVSLHGIYVQPDGAIRFWDELGRVVATITEKEETHADE